MEDDLADPKKSKQLAEATKPQKRKDAHKEVVVELSEAKDKLKDWLA